MGYEDTPVNGFLGTGSRKKRDLKIKKGTFTQTVGRWDINETRGGTYYRLGLLSVHLEGPYGGVVSGPVVSGSHVLSPRQVKTEEFLNTPLVTP